MTDRPIIDRPTVLAMINLLDWLYKSGVENARDAEDDGLCREFLDNTDVVGVYGFLTDNYIIGWQEWVLRLAMQARRTNWTSPMNKYLSASGNYGQNYLSVFYPVSLLWYRLGIQHYLDCPNATDIVKFRTKSKTWWTSHVNKNIGIQEYVDLIQQQCFNLERKHREVAESTTISGAKKQGCLKPTHFQLFRRCISLALMTK